MLKLLSLFSGIGAFEKALDNLNVDYELVNFCEFDKYAVKSYCAIHNVDESKNLEDITTVDEKKLPKDIDILTYGFPCQDISLAGKQQGLFNEDGTLTRSGLFFDALRIIEHCQPKIAVAENVKNLVSKKFNAQFQVVLASLDCAGYNNYYAVLNAKDFGVPQNRERVFIVSIRKDIDTGVFEFPKPVPLDKRLRDLMEDRVDEKYYLDDKFQEIRWVNDNYAILYGGVIGKMHDISRRVYNPNYIAPTLHTCAGGNLEPKVLGGVGERTSNNCSQWYQQDHIYDDTIGISVTTGFNPRYIDVSKKRPRKLTPKECFRLMGFDDESFRKAEAVNSNTQLYKQAGNSIVVNVLEHLLLNVLKVLKVLNYNEVVYDKR